MSTILIVEDMAVFREPIAAALQQRGYQTVEAENGAVALEKMQRQPADLILLDVAMPVLDGLGFLRRLRADPRWRDLPVVLLTAVTRRDYVLEAGKLGVRDYILKARFTLAELFARVDKYLRPGDGAAAQPSPAGQSAPRPQNQSPPAQATSTPAAADAPTPRYHAPPPDNRTAVEALKSITPITTRSLMNEKVKTFGELKALSPTVSQLLKLTQSASCSLERIARVINQDQAIALKVLKLANSVVYARGEPVESVLKAVMRIGLAQIRQVVLNISVMEHFTLTELSEHFNAQLFWEHSIATGLISASINRALGADDATTDTSFTIGLLHDVGRMVLASELGEEYATVLRTAYDLRLPLEQVETRMLLVNHADFMDKVLHAWDFPKHLINPIALHHLSMANMRTLAPRSLQEVSVLALANRMAHALLLGSSGNQAIYPTQDFARALKLRAEDVQAIVANIPEQTRDLKLAMLSATAGGAVHDVRMKARQRLSEQVGGLRPIAVSVDPAIDAHVMLADVLRERDDQPPNVVVAHIENARDRSRITALIKAQEQAAGVRDLPTILISPAGSLRLEESAMANRRCEMLPSPVALERFIEAVIRLLASVPQAAAA